MKTLIPLWALILCLSFSLHAQSGYSIDPESFEVSYNEDLANVSDLRMDALMFNSSTIAFGFDWEIVNIEMPEEWELSVSDKDISYFPGITNNQTPLTLEGGETSAPYNIHLYPNQKAGCGSWEVLITLANDPNVVIDTIEYEVTVNDDDCMLSSVYLIYQEARINFFPNPFSDVLNFGSEYPIREVSISDLTGKELFHQQGIDIKMVQPALVNGTYLVSLHLTDGTKVIRRIVRIK